jgi:hypothetical protein
MLSHNPPVFCSAPASFRHEFITNRDRDGDVAGLFGYGFFCAAHVGLHHPEGVTVGEPLSSVIARARREARARQGTAIS